MSDDFSFLWHDYETFGTNPALDRPCQFAALRTNELLEEIEQPLVLFCRSTRDYLPNPDAVLVTGITPQMVAEKGLPEWRFAQQINGIFSQPGTCGVGYNSIRFDDEFTRNLFYRNLMDPYAREWRDGNSRWDLIDVVRMTYALRPDGIHWPEGEHDGPSFRLERLAEANDISHEEAHDALGDVRATIALARLVRKRQPRLWNYALGLRNKLAARKLLDVAGRTPVLHISSRYPASNGCAALVVPLAQHPRNRNSVIVWNLSQDPAPLLADDADNLRERLYSTAADLDESQVRPALKEVHLNRSPMLVTAKILNQSVSSRLGIDLSVCERHRTVLGRSGDLSAKIARIFAPPEESGSHDPELMLYSSFIPNRDRANLDRLRAMPADDLAKVAPVFEDPRLEELLFRYRARHFPDTLNATERAEWREHCRLRLIDGKPDGVMSIAQCRDRIAVLRQADLGECDNALLDAVEDYTDELAKGLG